MVLLYVSGILSSGNVLYNYATVSPSRVYLLRTLSSVCVTLTYPCTAIMFVYLFFFFFFFFFLSFFFFKQKTAYEIVMWLEFRRVLFRSSRNIYWHRFVYAYNDSHWLHEYLSKKHRIAFNFIRVVNRCRSLESDFFVIREHWKDRKSVV